MKNKVKELRKSQKLTQEELAELIGISRQAINAIEKENIYNNNKSNVYLSKYFPFITENKNHPIIQDLIFNALNDFFNLHVCCYENYKDLEINFIGSVGYFLSDEINIVAKKHNCKIGGIVKNPINNLIDFHFNKIKPSTDKVFALNS
jgi:DNA-binding XRE family transcriptional regulator